MLCIGYVVSNENNCYSCVKCPDPPVVLVSVSRSATRNLIRLVSPSILYTVVSSPATTQPSASLPASSTPPTMVAHPVYTSNMTDPGPNYNFKEAVDKIVQDFRDKQARRAAARIQAGATFESAMQTDVQEYAEFLERRRAEFARFNASFAECKASLAEWKAQAERTRSGHCRRCCRCEGGRAPASRM